MKAVEYLLRQEDIDINVKTIDGRTVVDFVDALFYKKNKDKHGKYFDKIMHIKELLENKLKHKISNLSRAAPSTSKDVYLLTKQGNIDAVKDYLIEGFLDVNEQDADDNTLLHYAAIGNHKELVKLFIEKKANINK